MFDLKNSMLWFCERLVICWNALHPDLFRSCLFATSPILATAPRLQTSFSAMFSCALDKATWLTA